MNTPTLNEIKLLQKNHILSLVFDNGESYELSCEYLRVYSPSAEVKGHGVGQEVLQTGKKYVNIIGIDPVGNYAVRLVFDDGHQSGLFSWDTLYNLSIHHAQNWQKYLTRLAAANASREPLQKK